MKITSPIHRANRQLKIRLEEFSNPRGLAADEAHCIAFITAYGPCTMGEVSRVLGLKPSTLTSMVTRLCEQKYLKRQHDKNNRRQILVSTTAKGTKLAETGWKKMEAMENEIRSKVSARDLAGFQAVLKAIDTTLKIEVRQK